MTNEVKILNVDWADIVDLSALLADKIENHCVKTGEQFDKIILIPRGSYFICNIVARRLGFDAAATLHMCMTSYKDGEKQAGGEFKYGQMPLPEEVAGLNLVIIEEVCDTGRTLKHAIELLHTAGANIVRTATTHYKPSKSTTGVVPDFYAVETDAWIKYPWEIHEKIGESSVVRRRPVITELVGAII
jgi:uncharacterized protein